MEYIEYQCSVCESINADLFCFACLKLLCNGCYTVNSNCISTHTQKVLPLSNDTISKILTEKCEKHPNEVIQYFCRHHDALLCKQCQQQDHRRCKGVKQISEAADDLIADQNLQVVSDQLESTLSRVSKVEYTFADYKYDLQQKEDTNLKYLDDYEQTLTAKVGELAAKGRNNIMIAHKQIISTANWCSEEKALLSKYLEDMNRSQNRKAHLFILKKKGPGIVKRVEDKCRESEDMIKNRPFIFRSDTQIVESLNGFSSLVKEIKLYTRGQRSDTKIKISVDKEDCNIMGICRLGDGTLVISDYGNKRLKRVDPSTNRFIKHCDMKEKTRGLCSIGPQEVAVANGSITVHIISAQKGLTPSRTVDVGQETDTIAYHGGKLFAGCGDRLTVHNINSGEMTMDISRNGYGTPMFSRITGIAVNQTGDRVYVSDYNNGLVCLTPYGMVWCLSNFDMGLDRAWGVTTDHWGSVMVAGRLSHNVVQVTVDGLVLGEILAEKDGICYPQCLYYDVHGRKLYVGGETSQLLGFELF